MSPRDLPVSEAQRAPGEESGGLQAVWRGGKGEGEGQTEMRYCLAVVKEVCCARGFKVGGERNMCCGRRRETEVVRVGVGVGGQSNDSAAMATTRYPRNVWRRDWTRAEEHKRWLLVSISLICATVERKTKCKRNEWCCKKKSGNALKEVQGVMKISQSLIATDGIKKGAWRVEVFPEWSGGTSA